MLKLCVFLLKTEYFIILNFWKFNCQNGTHSIANNLTKRTLNSSLDVSCSDHSNHVKERCKIPKGILN